ASCRRICAIRTFGALVRPSRHESSAWTSRAVALASAARRRTRWLSSASSSSVCARSVSRRQRSDGKVGPSATSAQPSGSGMVVVGTIGPVDVVTELELVVDEELLVAVDAVVLVGSSVTVVLLEVVDVPPSAVDELVVVAEVVVTEVVVGSSVVVVTNSAGVTHGE